MSQEATPAPAVTRQVKAELDGLVVTIELTLISIIQGVALTVLAEHAVEPVVTLQVEYWPYVLVGLLSILMFWSRAVLHTLSFIGWPLEFRHTFLYFAVTLVETLAFTQVTHVVNWFLLSGCFAAAIWVVYWYDWRTLAREEWAPEGAAARRLLEVVRRDQLRNLRLTLPLFFAADVAAVLLILRWPAVFLGARWHVLLALVQAAVGVWYLLAGLPSLAGRDSLIYQRFLERQAGLTRSG